MKKIKQLHLVSHEMKWETFKKLNDALVRDSGPTAMNLDKILWKLIRERKIYAWFCEEISGNMGLGLKLPPHEKLIVLNSP